jgi:WbqC-like protein family
MKVSINQPAFFPWLGYYHRIAISDLHIVLDDVQFEKNSYVNRNKIKTQGDPLWLTVPLLTSGKFGNLAINKVEISQISNWKKKTIESVRQFYRKAPYFKDFFPYLEDVFLNYEWVYLNDLIKHLNKYFLDSLEINTPLINSSDIQVEGVKSELVLNLCKKVNCTTYISGPFGKNYLDKESFDSFGINICYHEYIHPQYPQLYSGFTPNLSIVDLLMNCGPDSRNILMSNQL